LLSLDHQVFLNSYLNNYSFRISDFLFSNLFLFRHKHEYKVVRDDIPYIIGKTYDNKKFAFLLTPPKQISKRILSNILLTVDFLYPIPTSWKDDLSEKEFVFEVFDADSDYLFEKKTLTDYPGRDLSKKRNLVHQFTELYNAEMKVITKNDVFEIKKTLDIWQAQIDKSYQSTDYYPCLEALQMQEILGLYGIFLVIDGKSAGFILGEEKNDTFYMHFAKADISYKGIFQFMYQKFSQSLKDNISYINLEQDLGDLNLRHAKHSYHPDSMEIKYRVHQKN